MWHACPLPCQMTFLFLCTFWPIRYFIQFVCLFTQQNRLYSACVRWEASKGGSVPVLCNSCHHMSLAPCLLSTSATEKIPFELFNTCQRSGSLRVEKVASLPWVAWTRDGHWGNCVIFSHLNKILAGVAIYRKHIQLQSGTEWPISNSVKDRGNLIASIRRKILSFFGLWWLQTLLQLLLLIILCSKQANTYTQMHSVFHVWLTTGLDLWILISVLLTEQQSVFGESSLWNSPSSLSWVK